MIKVLVVESTVYGYDGISNVVKNYYTYLDHDAIWMDLVTGNPVDEKLGTLLQKNGNTNFVIPNRNRNPVQYVRKLVRIIQNGKYSILHVHGCSATMAVEMLAGMIAGVKVRIAHSHNTECDHIWVDKLLRPFFNRWCNVGFACSDDAGKWLFSGKHFYTITNGIDLQKFRYDEATREVLKKDKQLEGKFVIGHVGRFSRQKNHERLIDVYAKIKKNIPDSVLVLVGEGELREEVESKAKDLQLDVLFAGTSDHVEEWLQVMDIMIFPSLYEGLPLGLVEAQAAALPCVLSDNISPMIQITDIVKFESLTSSDEKWAEDALSLITSYDRKHYGTVAAEMVRKAHYDIRENCVNLSLLYKKLVEKYA